MDVCKHTMTVTTAVALDGMLLPSTYKLAYTFRVKTPNFEHQNVAFLRIKHLLEERIQHCLMLSRKDPNFKVLSKMGNNLFIMPEDPMDFAVCCALFIKLNAICEGKFDILTLQLQSSIGDNVEYIVTADDMEEIGAFLDDMPKNHRWWADSGPNINRLQEYVTWEDLTLTWDQPEDAENKAPARVIQFNPVIVEGGKNKVDK